MTIHDGSHWTQVIKQPDADGIERPVGLMCFNCEKTWWKDGKVTSP